MNTQYTYPQKPTLVSVIAWTTLACGIVNIFWGLAASGMALATIVGICCTPLTILPSILGIFEILYAVKLLGNPPQPVQPAKTIAVLEILCVLTGNVFAMVVGILSLVFYSDPIVKDYFARLNGFLPPEPVPPATPIPPVVPNPPAPVVEPIPSPITGEEPIPPAAPLDEALPEEITPKVEDTVIIEPEPSSEPAPIMDQTIISVAPQEPIVEALPPSEPEPPAEPQMDATIISSHPTETFLEQPLPSEPETPIGSTLDETIISSSPWERPAEELPASQPPQEPENPEKPGE